MSYHFSQPKKQCKWEESEGKCWNFDRKKKSTNLEFYILWNYPSKLRRNKDFPRQTDIKGISSQETCLERNTKRRREEGERRKMIQVRNSDLFKEYQRKNDEEKTKYVSFVLNWSNW